MKPLRRIKTWVKNAKPPKFKNKLPAQGYSAVEGLKSYIESLKPKDKKFQRKVLDWMDILYGEDLGHLNVSKHISSADLKAGEREPCLGKNQDDSKIIYLVSQIIPRLFNALSYLQEHIHSFAFQDLIEHILGFMMDERGKNLSCEEKSKLIVSFEGLWNRSNDLGIKFVEFILQLTQNKKWKKIETGSRVWVIHSCTTFWKQDPRKAEIYVGAIFKMLDNFEDVRNTNPKSLLKTTIRNYLESVNSDEIGNLQSIQEIIRDIFLLDPEYGFDDLESIFEGVSKDQFMTLCSALAERNPVLVQFMGEELEPIWSEAA